MEQVRVRLANGIELDVVDTGPPPGQDGANTLIFLHGFPESHRTGATRLRISATAIAALRPTSAAIAVRRNRRTRRPIRQTS